MAQNAQQGYLLAHDLLVFRPVDEREVVVRRLKIMALDCLDVFLDGGCERLQETLVDIDQLLNRDVLQRERACFKNAVHVVLLHVEVKHLYELYDL